MPPAKGKFEATSSSTRVLDQADADKLAAVAEGIVAANTASPQAAMNWLIRLGIVDKAGKPTKHYR